MSRFLSARAYPYKNKNTKVIAARKIRRKPMILRIVLPSTMRLMTRIMAPTIRVEMARMREIKIERLISGIFIR